MKLFIIAVLFVALNAYGSPELLEAAERGDVVEVKRLIDAGADVNFQDNKGETALISTVRSLIRGKSDVAQALIDAGADVNIQSYNGSTALQIAVLFEHLDVVGVLIDAGANLDIQNDYGDTALTYAAQIGDFDTAQTLIDAGADVNIQNNSGSLAADIAKIAVSLKYSNNSNIPQALTSFDRVGKHNARLLGDTPLATPPSFFDRVGKHNARPLLDRGAPLAAPPSFMLASHKCVKVTEKGIEKVLVFALKSSEEPTFVCYRRIENTLLLDETATLDADVTDLLLED